MFKTGRPIVPFLGSLLLMAFVIGAGVLTYNAGASQGSFLGVEVAPVVAGLLAVLLLLFVLRLAARLVLMPFFGLGFMGWRRRSGHGWGRHGRKHDWKRGWDDKQGKWSKQDWEEGVPPMVAEWHRRLHAMPAQGEGPQAPA